VVREYSLTGPEEPRTDLTQTVLRGAGVAGAGFALKQALSLGLYLALARVASPTDFGQYAAGSVLVVVGTILSESGMLAAVIQRRDRIEEAASTAVVSTVAGGLGLSLLALAASPLIGFVFQSETIGLVAAAMSGTVVLNSAQQVPQALLQRRFSFVRRVVTDPVALAAFGVTSLIACGQGLGAWGLVLGSYVAGMLELALVWIFARWRPQLRLASVGMWRELIAYGRHVLASELVVRGGLAIESVVVGRGVSTAALGQYGYAMRIAGQPLSALVNVASYVLFPTFAHIATDEPRLRAGFMRSLRWMALIALPSSLLLFAIGEPLAVLLLGETWRPAGEAVMALCLYSAGHAVAGIGGEAFKATGRTDLLFRMHATAVSLTIVFMLLLLPFGLNGVAAAVSLGAVGMAAYSIGRVPVVLSVSTRRLLSEIWPPTAAAVVAAAALFPLEQFVIDADGHSIGVGFLLVGVEGALGVAIYGSALRVLSPSQAAELLNAVKRAVALPYLRLRPRQPQAPGPQPPAL
jgi:O-antigen/teichoic acid export membrane protein